MGDACGCTESRTPSLYHKSADISTHSPSVGKQEYRERMGLRDRVELNNGHRRAIPDEAEVGILAGMELSRVSCALGVGIS